MSSIKGTDGSNQALDLDDLRRSLSGKSGALYWRSLEELTNSDAFRRLLKEKLPQQAAMLGEHVDRREFMSLMAASLALAGLTGCTVRPAEKIVPYVKPPEELVPGKPLFFATAMPFGGAATGLLVESNMGRPTKIDGNPEHPASLGASDVFMQAAILGLYDPDRSQAVVRGSRISTWETFVAEMATEMESVAQNKGRGFRILTEGVISPSLGAQLTAFLDSLPEAKWHQFEPAGRENVREGARLAFGEPVDTIYRFESADVVVALDSDFFQLIPGHLRYAREFARRRQPGGEGAARLYAIESSPTLVGAMADHRFAMRSGQVGALVRQMAGALQVAGVSGSDAGLPWFAAMIEDLQAHRGRSIVVAGDHQPAHVHAMVHAINQALGNVGSTVQYIDSIEAGPLARRETLETLVNDMNSGAVDHLVILGGNPVYSAPVNVGFANALEKVRLRTHCSLYQDETSALCSWHLPEAHFLESWGDARAFDGTATIVQPLIDPLYNGKTHQQVVAALMGKPPQTPDELVRTFWMGQLGANGFEKAWRRTLHDGVVANTARPPKAVTLRTPLPDGPASAAGGVELVFRTDPSAFDGRFANNGWLQELPKPFSKVTWDSPALISPKTATRLGVSTGDVVEITVGGNKATWPVWVSPGQSDESVTVHLGLGRTRAGSVGNGVGTNAYQIRPGGAWIVGAEIQKTGDVHVMSSTQEHHDMEHRDLVRIGTFDEFREDPNAVRERAETHGSGGEHAHMFENLEYTGYAWGLSINLNNCIGCNACTIACQSENNIPVVGKREVGRGREMHWIRVDHYFEGSEDAPNMYHQPVTCMHCENAPCEVVCPVAATTHSEEGLNEMTYNRCVGTRYCSNNCPYKVRRFNFFQYADFESPSIGLMYNPEVTVRTRGVMEKCTYCVQRINRARINAEKEGRLIRDGEIVTACQSACPTEAIIFGNINDKESRVAKAKESPLNYGLLTELATRPRTTYGARLRNPNPKIQGG